MDVSDTVRELESIIEAVESANAKLAAIKQALSATVRKSDLVDEAEMSIVWAASKLKRLKIVCLSERTSATQSPDAQAN